MTENLLGLRENPFAAGHDSRLIFLTPEREEILARLRHGLHGGEAFLLVTGEPGIGKTSVIYQVLESENASSAFITHPMLKRNELLEEICIRFEVELPESPSTPQALSRLERHLSELRSRNETPVLVIDEAQDLNPELLEELRLISNLEANGRPLIQIVLAGLPEFEGRLRQQSMAQFRQRIATHCRIGALSAEQIEGYIHHRIAVAGGEGPERFPKETCVEIHRIARGVPRAINTIAGQAILRASRESARSVTPAHIQASAADSWLRTVSEAPAPPRPERLDPPRPKDATTTPREDRKSDDPDVKAWVSRFVDPTRPLRIGSRNLGAATRASQSEPEPAIARSGPASAPPPETAPKTPARSSAPSSKTPPSRPAANAPASEAKPTAPPAPRRAAHKKPSRLPIRAGMDPRVAALRDLSLRLAPQPRQAKTLALLLVAAVGAFLFARAGKFESPDPVSVAPATTKPTPIPQSPWPQPPPLRERSSIQRSAPPKPRAVADTTATPKQPARRLGLEAGVFINPDRAQEEKASLAVWTGLPVQVMEITEDGVVLYRVVVGSFGGRRKAQRAANDLVSRGLLEQVRIIVLAESDSTR
jgi:type II secretory pathway predicted ATPase ExeA